MDVVPEVMMSEEVCGGVFAFALICFLPVRNWWKSLKPETKVKIPLLISTLVGTGDTGLDWFVLSNWYDEGLSKMASALLLCIFISGSVFAWFTFGVSEIHLWSLNQPFIIFVSCLGMGNIVLAILVISQPEPDRGSYYVPKSRNITNQKEKMTSLYHFNWAFIN